MNVKFNHQKDGDGNHTVSVSGLRVLITEDAAGLFCAQGLEIDYAAAGDSVESVRDNFMNGFCETILQHLDVFGDCKALLIQGPQDAWDLFYALENDVRVTSESFKPELECPDLLPGFLSSINFIEQPNAT